MSDTLSFLRTAWFACAFAFATSPAGQRPPQAQDALPGAATGGPLSQATVQLLTAARAGDPRIAALRSAAVAADARLQAAGFAPPAGFSASATDGPGGDVLAGNVGVELGRGLFLGARREAARTRAQAELVAAKAELDAAEGLIELRLLSALGSAASATRIIDRFERSDRWLADAEAALAARLAVGEARYIDVLRVRTERLQATAERSRLAGDRIAAIEGLRAIVRDRILDDSLETLVDVAATASAWTEWRTALDDGPSDATLLTAFPAVRQATAEAAAARADRTVAAAALSAETSGAIGLQRIGPANGGPTIGLMLGFSRTLPFTAATARERSLGAADAAILAAETGRVAAEAHALATVRAARARYEAARTRVDAFDTALLVAADAEREAALAAYRAGSLTLLDLLDFERALVRVEVERTRALLDALQARGALFGLELSDIGVAP